MEVFKKSDFWYWEAAILKNVCNSVVKETSKKQKKIADIGIDRKIDKEIRDCSLVWLPRMHHIECILTNFAREANYVGGWNFDLTIQVDKVQIAKYDKGGQYSAHTDTLSYDELGFGWERKLTAVLLLSDPSEYKGGDLVVGNTVIPTKKQGSIIVFPSYSMHKVTPVTSGIRHSATCWIPGPKFK